MARFYYTIIAGDGNLRENPPGTGKSALCRAPADYPRTPFTVEQTTQMESIVFFGKGGIGKSTIAASVTSLLAAGGKKVLHIGCDPKMDCTLSLMGRHIEPFAILGGSSGRPGLRDSIYQSPVRGVHCIEAGGPQPGVGCGGTAIGSMLDAMKDEALLEKDGYGAAVFDVLGDVVCGGFAAPLRRGFAKKMVIVTSEEILSLYAANRLIMMAANYARNGVYLAGLAVNLKDQTRLKTVEEFARAVNTRILGVMLQDPAVSSAEREHRPAAIAYPKSGFARRVWALTQEIRTARPPATPPRALPDPDFFAFAEGRRTAVPAGAPAGKGRKQAVRSAKALFSAAGFKPAGMEDSQIICDWKCGQSLYKVVIAPGSSAKGDMPRISDWAVCFHPTTPQEPPPPGGALMKAAGTLAGLRFDEMLSVFTGSRDFYGPLLNLSGPEDTTLAAPDTPRRPHMGFGQWQRFIFPAGLSQAYIPPGSVMVEHGDIECRFCSSESGILNMFNDNPGIKTPGKALNMPVLPRIDKRIVNTGFSSDDALFGDEKKVARSLEAAADKAGPGGLVEFYVGCSPIMLAGDTSSLAARVEREKGVKIMLERFNSFYEHGSAKGAVRVSYMAHKLSKAGAAKDRDVYLADSHDPTGVLDKLLAEHGISTVDRRKDFYREAASARLQVLSHPDTVLTPAFDKAGLKWIMPPQPYGFGGTHKWLGAIASALGRKKAPAGPSAAQKALAAGLWARASRYTAAFVLATEEIGLLSGSTALKMVPVLPVLAEAGFKVRLLLMTAEGRDGKAGKPGLPAEAAAQLRALKASLPGTHLSTDTFSKQEELARLLRADPPTRLVYSDIRRDPRVVSAGKYPFSTSLFEPGYDGALETWRRLLALCEWDFNERYLRN